MREKSLGVVLITSTRIITSLILFVLAVSSSNALVNLDSDESAIFFCDYGTKSFSFNVTNSFSYPVTVTLSKAGSITQFADVQFLASSQIGPVISLDLSPGQVVQVSAIMTLNRAVDYGEKELLVSLDWGSSITKSFKVVVSNCHSVSLEASESSKSTCLLSPVEYVFSILNNGEFDEVLSLSLSGEGLDYARLSTDSVTLRQGESKNVYLFFYPSRFPGNFSTIVKAFNSRISEFLTFDSSVSKCADYSVSVPGSVESCEGAESVVGVNLSNVGAVADSYDISVSSSLKHSLSASKISLSPGSSGFSTLKFFSACGTDGVFNATITVKPSEALDAITRNVTVIVRNCFDFSVSNSKTLPACACESVEGNFSVRNNGFFAQNYSLKHGSDELVVGSNYFSLASGSVLVLPFSFKTCKPGSYSVPVSFFEESSCRDSLVSDLSFRVVDDSECFSAKLSSQDAFDLNELSQYNLAFSVKNQGLRSANYSVSFSGSASSWVYAVSAENFSLNVNEAQAFSVLVIPPSGLSDREYSLSVNVFSDGSLISSKSVKFSKPSSPAPERVVQPQTDGDLSFFEYFFFSFLVFSLIVLFLKSGSLASFLRNRLGSNPVDGAGKRGRKARKG